jgi:tetratricopeptide (TPR) repeat protein
MTQDASSIEVLYHRALHLYQQVPVTAEAGQFHALLRRQAAGGLYDAILTGLASAAEGRFEEALASYDQALTQGCDPHKVLYALKSRAQMRLGRYDEALATCDAGIALAPGNLSLYEYKLALLLEMGRLADTVPLYDDILKVRPQAAEILLFKALALFLLEQTAQARRVLVRLLATLPDAARFPFFRENMRAHLVQYEARVDEYLIGHRESPDAWYCAGLVRLLGDPDGSVPGAFKQALRCDPEHAWALHGQGIAHMARGEYRQAATAFARACALAPDVIGFASARERAARAAEGSVSPIPPSVTRPGTDGKRRQHRRGKGSATHRRSIGARGELPSQEQLEQLLAGGRDEEALAAVEQIVAAARGGCADVNLEGALWLQARLLLDLERSSEAISVYRELLRRAPRKLAAWGELSDILLFQGRLEESLSALDGALEHIRDDGALYRKRASMLAMLGRHAEALQAIEQARRLEPEAGDLLAMLETVSLNALGRYDEALRRSDEALRSLSLDARARPMVIGNRGDALLALGHAQEALAVYEEALRAETSHRSRPISFEDDSLFEGTLYPQLVGDVRTLLLGGMGNAWLVLGDGGRALEYYDRALALGPNEALEANREQALALLHDSSEAARTTREEASLPSGCCPASGAAGQQQAILLLKPRAQRFIEGVGFLAVAAIAVALMGSTFVGFDLGAWVRGRPVGLLVAGEILLCVIYAFCCWFGWTSVPGFATLARPFRGWHTPLHRARRALVCGGTSLFFSVLLLQTCADASFRLYPSDHLTPALLLDAVALLVLHLLAWPALTLWAKRRPEARRGARRQGRSGVPFLLTPKRGTARADERGQDEGRSSQKP